MTLPSFVAARIRLILGLFALLGLLAVSPRLLSSRGERTMRTGDSVATRPASSSQALARTGSVVTVKSETIEQLAARDPLAVFDTAIERYDRGIRDYTCTFIKQERIGGILGAEQTIEVMFRENPYSVRMKWIKNPDKCSRALYVADRWTRDGAQMALIEPRAIARLFVPFVMRPIHGEDAGRSSRRTLDLFGFRNSLVLASKYVRKAREQNVPHSFQYIGDGEINGYRTMIFERHLPYTGEDGPWPDKALIVHIDKERLLPVMCRAFADDSMTILLGSYGMTDIQLNTNLADSVFTREGMGL